MVLILCTGKLGLELFLKKKRFLNCWSKGSHVRMKKKNFDESKSYYYSTSQKTYIGLYLQS